MPYNNEQGTNFILDLSEIIFAKGDSDQEPCLLNSIVKTLNLTDILYSLEIVRQTSEKLILY